ncbi:MAG: methyltransferase [Candidatus Binatia bacterium]
MKNANGRSGLHEAMLGHITAFWLSQLIFVAARLGIADALSRGPLSAEAIAEKVGAHAPSIRRVLRALASAGVFAEQADGRFRLTRTAATLRSDVPGSLRNYALMQSGQWVWNAWGHLLHGVTTGELPFDHVYGMPVFEYLRTHPDEDRLFSASMASLSSTENAAVARGYNFGRFRSLVDVGGAHGHLLACILQRHRRLRGVLYDQPQVVAGAAASGFISAPAIASRCTAVGGDFFVEVPASADAYLLKYITHNWSDERAARILTNCRTAMAPRGRVFVVDHVVKPDNAPGWAKLLDVNMMVATTGHERTRNQFEELFARAGLRLLRVHPTAVALRILEGAAA